MLSRTHIRPCYCKRHRDDIDGFAKRSERIRDWYEVDTGWVSSVTGEIVDRVGDVHVAIGDMRLMVDPIVEAVRDGRKTGGQLASDV